MLPGVAGTIKVNLCTFFYIFHSLSCSFSLPMNYWPTVPIISERQFLFFFFSFRILWYFSFSFLQSFCPSECIYLCLIIFSSQKSIPQQLSATIKFLSLIKMTYHRTLSSLPSIFLPVSESFLFLFFYVCFVNFFHVKKNERGL